MKASHSRPLVRTKPVATPSIGANWFLVVRAVSCSLLCGTLAAAVSNVRATQTVYEQTQTEALYAPELDAGFHLLYELKPQEARCQFEAWQKSHPDDPLGSASEAASYLFEESYGQGVLTSEFFLDDKRFLGKIPLKPDPKLRAAFFATDQRAQDLAQLRLKTNPNDPNALFAMSLSLGMQADYASLIDKHQLDSLKKIREADVYAKKLLVAAPDAADAYLGLGMANYFIGSLPGPKKFFLRFAGIHGDKKAGIEQIEIAADHGRYLRPFAKILLAQAALREKNQKLRAHNSRSSSRNSRRTRCTLMSSQRLRFPLPRCDDGCPSRQPRANHRPRFATACRATNLSNWTDAGPKAWHEPLSSSAILI